jgi:hypothetical protein
MADLHPDPVINQLMGELQKIQNPAPAAPPEPVKKPDPNEEARIRIDQFEKERAWVMMRPPLNQLADGKIKQYLADLRVVMNRIENNLSYKEMAYLTSTLDNASLPGRRMRVTYSSISKWMPGWSIWSTSTIQNGRAEFFQEPVGRMHVTGKTVSFGETSMEFPGYLPENEAFEATKIIFYPANVESAKMLDEARYHLEFEESVPARSFKRVHTPEVGDFLRPCLIAFAQNQAIPAEVTAIVNGSGALIFKCAMIAGGKEPFHVKARVLRTNRFDGLRLLCIIQGKYLRKED